LSKRLTPSYISAAAPGIYTEKDLQAELRKRLTRDEYLQIVNPLAATPAMTNWAAELTRGAADELAKAKKIFDGLKRHVSKGEGGTRTAEETFAAWKDPQQSFCCQEYAKLFVALARAVGVNAFYVHLERDYSGRIVYHDCAAVFADGKALLVDPAYFWFGAPHREFVVLNDVQAVAHHYFQHVRIPGGAEHDFQTLRIPSDAQVARCRIAAKLHPNFAWGQIALANELVVAKRLRQARAALKTAFQLETNRWDAWQLKGFLALQENNPAEAITHLKKAADLNPDSGEIHYQLAHALLAQKKSEAAREELNTALRLGGLDGELEKDARHHLADLNEQPGGTPTKKSRKPTP
jgi:tetratricopeptide (TPR) repeat protein